jgi:transposase-like protein
MLRNQKEHEMTKKRTRRSFTAEQKAAILKRHFVDKVQVSDLLCEENKLQPSVFYEWQRRLLDNAAVALDAGRADRASTSRTRQLEDKIERLEAKLVKKDTVMAELLGEYVALKKELGEP